MQLRQRLSALGESVSDRVYEPVPQALFQPPPFPSPTQPHSSEVLRDEQDEPGSSPEVASSSRENSSVYSHKSFAQTAQPVVKRKLTSCDISLERGASRELMPPPLSIKKQRAPTTAVDQQLASPVFSRRGPAGNELSHVQQYQNMQMNPFTATSPLQTYMHGTSTNRLPREASMAALNTKSTISSFLERYDANNDLGSTPPGFVVDENAVLGQSRLDDPDPNFLQVPRPSSRRSSSGALFHLELDDEGPPPSIHRPALSSTRSSDSKSLTSSPTRHRRGILGAQEILIQARRRDAEGPNPAFLSDVRRESSRLGEGIYWEAFEGDHI